jgi:hypothetical protein
MRFVSSANQRGEVRARAATLSIFADEIDRYTVSSLTGDSNPYFSLNRFNFDAAHADLIPRAVAYSAGLLNYFFRGQMQISLPDAGIYSVVDHALFMPTTTGDPATTTAPTDAATGFKGFAKIKLKLLNTTGPLPPAGVASGTQTMANGTLVAIVKFHRNLCYKDDLSGELTAVAQFASVQAGGCRADSEEIVLSEAIAIGADNPVPFATPESPNGVELTFNFLQRQLPINAWDVQLQVVYRGQLGAEADAVVVSTKDISEPTFFSLFDLGDLVSIRGAIYDVDDIFYQPYSALTELVDFGKCTPPWYEPAYGIARNCSWGIDAFWRFYSSAEVTKGVTFEPPDYFPELNFFLAPHGQFYRIALLLERDRPTAFYGYESAIWERDPTTLEDHLLYFGNVVQRYSVSPYRAQQPEAPLLLQKLRGVNAFWGDADGYLQVLPPVVLEIGKNDANGQPYPPIAFDKTRDIYPPLEQPDVHPPLPHPKQYPWPIKITGW